MHRFLLKVLLGGSLGAALFLKIPSILAQSAPSSSVSVSDQAVLGQNGWYTSSVAFTINSLDDTGIGAIYYQIDSNPVTIVPITPPLPSANTSFSSAVTGQHTLTYWAKDASGNSETAHSLSFKIDVNSPGNWREFTTARTGNEHTFQVSVRVSDVGSGLQSSSGFVQYSVDEGDHWGYYQDATNCSSLWVEDSWIAAQMAPSDSGIGDAILTTPSIDFCNSNWSIDKKVRFKVVDVAGNESTKIFTINGPWLKALNGDIFGQTSITMNTLGGETNANSLVAANRISNFSTSGALVAPYPAIPIKSYAEWESLLSPSASLPNGRLPRASGSGTYIVTGSYVVDSGTRPVSALPFTAVVFVEGDLILKDNISLHAQTSLLFIVQGEILIDKSVEQLVGVYFSQGGIDTSYNGDGNKALSTTGSFLTAGDFEATDRSLSGSNNITAPSESVVFSPWHLVNPDLLALVTNDSGMRWEEISP